jgi:putative peptidoglycan lipid II flippase
VKGSPGLSPGTANGRLVTDAPGQWLSLRAVGRSALILTGGAVAVQAIGIVRELFVAAQVGISRDLDALLIALALPMTLAGVLTSGTSTALVPAYLDARAAHGLDAARRLAGAVLVWVGLGGIGISAALVLFADVAIAVTGPGLSAASHASSVTYLCLLAPVAFVSAVGGTLRGVCQAEERFAAMAWAGLAGAVATLAVTLLLWGTLGLGAFAVANLAGPIVTAVALLGWAARSAVLPRLTLGSSGMGLRAFLGHAAPLMLSSLIMQLNVVSDRAIASLLAPGAVSALRYGEILIRTPINAIGPAWSSALYPTLVRAAHGDAKTGLADATAYTLRYALGVFVPVAVLTAAVAPVAVAVAFGRGAFSADDVARTAVVVAAFAPLIVVLMTSPVLASAHNARRNGRVLLAGGVLNVILNFVLDVVLGIGLGVAGVALSSSITSIVVVAMFAWRLARVEPAFAVRRIARTAVLATLASLPAAFVAALVSWSGLVPADTLVGLVALAALGTVGLLGYAAMAHLLGLDEIRTLVRLGLQRVAHRATPGGAA